MVPTQCNSKIIRYLNNDLIENNQILVIDKVTPKELYSFSIALKNEFPTFQKHISRFSPVCRLIGKRFIS